MPHDTNSKHGKKGNFTFDIKYRYETYTCVIILNNNSKLRVMVEMKFPMLFLPSLQWCLLDTSMTTIIIWQPPVLTLSKNTEMTSFTT